MRPVYYWDSTVWIAWLKGDAEPHTDDERTGLEGAASDISDGRAYLAASTMILTEVLQGNLDSRQRASLEAFFEHPDMILFDVNVAIAKRAADIRNHCKQANIRCPRPSDSIHVATAVAANAVAVHSFDVDHYGLDGKLPMIEIPIMKPRGLKKQLPLMPAP